MNVAMLVCPYCRSPIQLARKIRRCTGCGALYHSECWKEYGRCSVFGCTGKATPDGQQLLYIPAIIWTICSLHQAIAVMFSFLLAPAIVYCLLATLYYLWDLFYGFEVEHRMVQPRLQRDLLFAGINSFPIVLTILFR